MRVLVPEPNGYLWPTLGPEVCDFIEAFLVHGPGDVLGDPVVLTDEEREIIYRLYEVYPRGHARAGRRRVKRAGISRRKGWAKTEAAAWIAITEAHPEGPVRCDGFRKEDGEWIPVGRPVRDPYIPMVATTEEQVEDLAYGAVYSILMEDGCEVAADFDVGLDRTMVRRFGSTGEIKPLAAAPSSREGARTTFQHFDETHLFLSERLHRAHRVMNRNLGKRKAADPWGLETTTGYAPGEASVAEDAHHFAEQILAGDADSPEFYYDHLQADESFDISNDKGLRAALAEASGDAIAWLDVDAVMAEFRNPKIPESESRRYWLNQPRASAKKWIAPVRWEAAFKKRNRPRKGSKIYLGFWGGVNRDSAGLVAVDPRDGHCFVVGSWEPPPGLRIDDEEVEAEVAYAHSQWQIVEFVNSRTGGSGWISEIEEWHDTYGSVVEIPINSPARMAPACDRVYTAVHDPDHEDLTHDGNPTLARHISNCVPAKSVHGTYIRPGPGENQHISLARALVLAYERAMAPEDEEEEEDEPVIFFGYT